MNVPEENSQQTPAPAAQDSQDAGNNAVDTDAADSLVLTLPDESAAPKDVALWAGVLVLLALVVYWPTTNGSLLWNDLRNVQAADVSTIWAQRWADSAHYPLNQYHPVAATLYRFLYTALGRDAHGIVIPFTFHLAALILHCAAGLLLWLILRLLKLPGAWLAAAVFLLHPINTETVAWIGQLPAVLAGALCFGSIYCYLRFAQDDGMPPILAPAAGEALACDAATDAAVPAAPVKTATATPEVRWAWYAGSAVLFILAMLSKSTAWAMPVLTAAALWWRHRLRKRDLLLLAPMLIIAIGLAIAAISYEQFLVGKSGLDPHWSATDRLIMLGRTFWFYLGKIVWPMPLSVLYPLHAPGADAMAYVPLGAAVLLAVILAAAMRCGRGPLAALISFVACLLPASGLVFLFTMFQSAEADHQAYIAAAPVIALVVGLLALILRKAIAKPAPRTGAAVVLSAVLVIVIGAASWARGRTFNGPVSFWQDTVAKDPNLTAAHNQLAMAYAAASEQAQAIGDDQSAQGDISAALEQVQEALKIDPRSAEAQAIWGRLLLKGGARYRAAAIEHLKLATQLNPKQLDALQELGAQLVQNGQYQAGREELNKALQIQSSSSYTHQMLGEAFMGLADDPHASAADRQTYQQRAINEERLALQSDASDIKAHIDLGNLLNIVGDTQGAIDEFKTVAQLQHAANADDPATWDVLGQLYGRRGRPGDMEAAAQFFRAAMQLDPAGTTDAKKHLGQAEAMLAQLARAATRPTTRATSMPSTTKP